MLFLWTSGHAAAVDELLRMLDLGGSRALAPCSTLSDLLNFLQGRKELLEGKTLTVTHFFNLLPKGKLPREFCNHPTFRRGLPFAKDLKDPNIAAVFRELLMQGTVMRKPDVMDDAVNSCHGRWIHAEMNSGNICYMFSSPLHGMYISWMLLPAVVECPFETVRDMTFAIIKKLDPSQQLSPFRIGEDSTDRPLEARYQYEFYRGVFAATGGGVNICPELLSAYGARKGHIELFVPNKKWGIELTWEGNGLVGRDCRFGFSGAYGKWLSSDGMIDYILLDCRTTMPEKPHPGKVPLLHQTAHGWLIYRSRNYESLPRSV
jgi:hypothetical protein